MLTIPCSLLFTFQLVTASVINPIAERPAPTVEELALITPSPSTWDPTRTRELLKRDIFSDVKQDVGNILSQLGSGIPAYVASGVPNFFQDFPTGDNVEKSLGIDDSQVSALPTQVLNIPGYGNWTNQGWNLRLHGNVYKQPNISLSKLNDLANIFLIGTSIDQLQPSEADQARNLTASIFVIQQGKQNVTFDILPAPQAGSSGEAGGGGAITPPGGNQEINFPYPTTDEGDYDSFVQINNQGLLAGNDTQSVQRLNVYAKGTDTGNATAYLVPSTGITFISDIDDILRITKIYQPKEGLLNSFARPFTQWENMPDIYANWSRSLPYAHFHYLTTTPEQVTRNYMDFIYKTYPGGSFDTRPLNFSDVSATLSIRKFLLEKIFLTYPQRKFVLVADTSNSDVMADYPQMATDFPNQVLCIFLRNTSSTDSGDKFPYDTEGFKNLNPQSYMFFNVPNDLINLDISNGQCLNATIKQNLTFGYQGLPFGINLGKGKSVAATNQVLASWELGGLIGIPLNGYFAASVVMSAGYLVVSTYRLTDSLFGDDSWPDCRDSHELDRINQLSHYSLNAKNELGLVRGYGYDKCVRPITDPPPLTHDCPMDGVRLQLDYEGIELRSFATPPSKTTKKTLHTTTQQEEDRQRRRDEKRQCKLRKILAREEMKFSHSIQFNAVPDWSSHYISYSNLKKLIYSLEKSVNQQSATAHRDPEASPLLLTDDPDLVFRRALDTELEKISSFYQLKELEVYGEVGALLKDREDYEREAAGLDLGHFDGPAEIRSSRTAGRGRHDSIFRSWGFKGRSTMSRSIGEGDEYPDSDDEVDESALLQHNPPPMRSSAPMRRTKTMDANVMEDSRSSKEPPFLNRRTSHNNDDIGDANHLALYASGVSLKQRTINLYVSLCELKSFIQLNKTGFSKALKKYDKILNRDLRSTYIKNDITPAYPFQQSTTEHLDVNLGNMEKAYADVVTKGDIATARRELRLHLREHVVWERNTVWREMIGIERKAQAANIGLRRTLLGGDHDPSNSRLQGDEADEASMKEIITPLGRVRCPTWLFSWTFFTLLGIVAIFMVLLFVPIMKQQEQQNCLAMLVFVSLLWATEVLPLFVTALLVPFLAVILRVLRSDEKPHNRLDAKKATRYIFASMWTPVIMLLLGGFTIAAALSKYHIAKILATFVLSKAGTRPRTVLIVNMFVAMIASMWISNVAAPVLCFSIIQPLLRNLPTDSQFSKALILGIALASNIGGAASPIASPQNIIALQNMRPEPGWGAWFFVALPVCIISILLIWLLLLATFQPGKHKTTIVPIRPMKDKFTGVQWFISIVTIITILLWCVTHQLEGIFGDMGVVAIIPIILFFGTGILTKEDFNNFLWTIIILAAGGLALGKAVSSSGLLHTIAGHITQWVEGMSLYGVLVVFAALILVIATFISHTVAALIILPLVHQVGAGMKEPHPNLLVMASAFMCSAAMGLPTSGFPNMTAIMLEDPQTGHRYLRVQHFLSRGIPASIITFAVVITVGYGLLLVAHF